MDAEQQAVPGYTYAMGDALGGVRKAIEAERQHVFETATQIIVAQNCGDLTASHAFARSLRSEAEGGWQDEYPTIWADLAG